MKKEQPRNGAGVASLSGVLGGMYPTTAPKIKALFFRTCDMHYIVRYQ